MSTTSVVPGAIVATTAPAAPGPAGVVHPGPPPPLAPEGLGPSGVALWDTMLAEWEPRPDELRLLVDAAATADLVDRLATALAAAPLTVEGSAGQQVAHPLLGELRQARTLLSSLLGRFGFTDDDTDPTLSGKMTASEAARRAARARWDRR